MGRYGADSRSFQSSMRGGLKLGCSRPPLTLAYLWSGASTSGESSLSPVGPICTNLPPSWKITSSPRAKMAPSSGNLERSWK